MKKNNLWKSILLVLVIVIAAAILLNRQWIYDWWRGLSYQPIGEMGRIMQDLGLTGRGEFLFKAAQPVLSSQDEFNTKCRTVMDEEMAVLGCYTDGDIYVYNIESAELDGIRELTTAHELLHVVWARMSEGERNELVRPLTQVFDSHQDILSNELDAYDTSQKQEELFVRAGTEIANLPTELEKVYGEIFTDQDAIAGFYNKYIRVFKVMEAEMKELSRQMETIQGEIDRLTAEYETRVSALDAEITNFNSCAETAGCFATEWEFYSKRAVLVQEQEALEGIYNQINGLVDEYNGLVEKYNADATRTEKLNRVMNSSSRPEKL
ncbi:hypothetical protein IJI28_01280 [Candidatus Saccharibacteria bacterium]|nr:hypothetical protein [Candidatus Saccharibacteria bacterium]